MELDTSPFHSFQSYFTRNLSLSPSLEHFYSNIFSHRKENLSQKISVTNFLSKSAMLNHSAVSGVSHPEDGAASLPHYLTELSDYTTSFLKICTDWLSVRKRSESKCEISAVCGNQNDNGSNVEEICKNHSMVSCSNFTESEYNLQRGQKFCLRCFDDNFIRRGTFIDTFSESDCNDNICSFSVPCDAIENINLEDTASLPVTGNSDIQYSLSDYSSISMQNLSSKVLNTALEHTEYPCYPMALCSNVTYSMNNLQEIVSLNFSEIIGSSGFGNFSLLQNCTNSNCSNELQIENRMAVEPSYDISFLFSVIFIVMGVCGNILVCLAVSKH